MSFYERRPLRMRFAHFYRILFCSLLLMVSVADPTHAQECFDLASDILPNQRSLYEYALIADMAYGESRPGSCRVEATGEKIELRRPHEISLLPEPTRNRIVGNVGELLGSREPRTDVIRYYGDDEITYLTCSSYDDDLHLALAPTLFRRPLLGDDSRVIVVLDIAVLINLQHLGDWKSPDEELGVVRLYRSESRNGDPEELVAIRGTNIWKIRQIWANLNDLFEEEGSCVFRMASVVVEVVEQDLSTRGNSLAVVGHSLGGSATQYVARENATRQSPNAMFSAFSFNGVGIDANSVDKFSLSSLYNYFIEGDFASSFGMRWGRLQAGRAMRYRPSVSWRLPSWFMFSLRPLSEATLALETIRRHGLDTVQKALCECMNARGSVAMNYDWRLLNLPDDLTPSQVEAAVRSYAREYDLEYLWDRIEKSLKNSVDGYLVLEYESDKTQGPFAFRERHYAMRREAETDLNSNPRVGRVLVHVIVPYPQDLRQSDEEFMHKSRTWWEEPQTRGC